MTPTPAAFRTSARTPRPTPDGGTGRYPNDEIVDRVVLDHGGKSGSRLERVTTAGGRVLVVKEETPRANWIMQATGDDGRIVRLWSSGVLRRLPTGVDCAIESVEITPTGWRVMMRDVAAALVPDGRRLTRAESREVMNASASVHERLAGAAVPGLCPLVDRLAFLTPSAVHPVAGHPLGAAVLQGWERFFELAPKRLGPSLLRLIERPGRLAAALAGFPAALLHGDLKVANLGFEGQRVVMLDWGTLSGMGPPAVEYAWFLAVNSAAISASLDELHDDVLEALRPDDKAALPLALLGALVQLGWEKALLATSDDATIRARERTGLRWWWARATEALERWSPA
jgi:hypothetical protein